MKRLSITSQSMHECRCSRLGAEALAVFITNRFINDIVNGAETGGTKQVAGYHTDVLKRTL